jgi:hypothetical protein
MNSNYRRRRKSGWKFFLAVILLAFIVCSIMVAVNLFNVNKETQQNQPSTSNQSTNQPVKPAVQKPIVPVFQSTTLKVSSSERSAMLASGSWRSGCPTSIDDLRVLELSYWGFDGKEHSGLLMVNADVATSVVNAFRRLFDAKFPIHQMELVDKYGADDEKSMLADNTSAYNCRIVPGTDVWSQHSYGTAIDINPFENPEVLGTSVDPPQAAKYADRSLSDKGMIYAGDKAVKASESVGWSWGGDWDTPKDYQHFSLSGT